MDDIRDNLKAYLRDHGYSQAAFARIVGVPPVSFNQICTKKLRLTADLLFRACDALEITPDQLRSYQKKETA